jgi:hypothetical protein
VVTISDEYNSSFMLGKLLMNFDAVDRFTKEGISSPRDSQQGTLSESRNNKYPILQRKIAQDKLCCSVHMCLSAMTNTATPVYVAVVHALQANRPLHYGANTFYLA